MKPDAILREIYAVREKMSAAVGYDAARFFAEVQRLQDLRKAQGVKYVSFAGRKRTPAAASVSTTTKPRRPSRRRPAPCAYPDTPAPALTVGEKPGEYRTAPARTPKKEKPRVHGDHLRSLGR
jgi:hypothetical protein